MFPLRLPELPTTPWPRPPGPAAVPCSFSPRSVLITMHSVPTPLSFSPDLAEALKDLERFRAKSGAAGGGSAPSGSGQQQQQEDGPLSGLKETLDKVHVALARNVTRGPNGIGAGVGRAPGPESMPRCCNWCRLNLPYPRLVPLPTCLRVVALPASTKHQKSTAPLASICQEAEQLPPTSLPSILTPMQRRSRSHATTFALAETP